MGDLNTTAKRLSGRIQRLLQQHASRPRQRILVALAGVPGSGKTSVCAALLRALKAVGIQDVAVVPMDGFHYSQATLATFPDPDLAFRKRGAPPTFDVEGLLELVTCLKQLPVPGPEEPVTIIRAPSFDHARKDPVSGGLEIPSSTRVVIVEGNYTLLDVEPWNKISDMAHERWFIDVPADLAKDRLIERHLRAGIETSRATAARRVEDNDLPNGALIRAKLIQPDVSISNTGLEKPLPLS